jgi:hypothetical protein
MTDTMTGRERVRACVAHATPDRTPYLRWDNFALSDFVVDWARPKEPPAAPAQPQTSWTDEWGCRWETVDSSVGQVVAHPISSPEEYADYVIPEPRIDRAALEANRAEYPDHVCHGGLGFFYFEIIQKLREFSGALMDLAGARELLEPFLDRLQEYYIAVVDLYAESGLVDCIGVNEDLGLQERMTISPAMWREVFKPRYKAVYDRIHEHGLMTFEHSCGYVQPIIADLAEVGVDILELQQLACMDMDAVARDRGRMVITAPVDIQSVLPTGDWARIEVFQKRLFRTFDRPSGGFIPQIYCDLVTLGVPESIDRRLESLILELCRWRDEPLVLD